MPQKPRPGPDVSDDPETGSDVDTASADLPVDDRPRFFGLSLTQLVASAFAAITATVAGSYLGVSGTVVGAALASVVTVIGNAVYAASLRRTRDRVRAVVPAVVPTLPASGRWATRASRHPAPTARGAAVPGADDRPRLPAPSPRVRPRPRPAPPARRGMPWRGIALATIGMFAATLAGVTVVEALAGRPLTDVVRGDSGKGTTIFGSTGGGHSTKPTPAPTVTVTVTPVVVATTPTVTRTAPASTRTVPGATRTATSTPTASTTTGSEPTSSTSQSAQGSAAP